MNKKRVCIGQMGGNARYGFSKNLEAIRAAFNEDSLSKFGLECCTETLRDLLSGGECTLKQILNKMNQDLMSDTSLPMFRKEKERVYKESLEDLESFARCMHKLAREFAYVLPEYYYVVEGTRTIDVLPQAFDAIDEENKIYIESPECIEAYNQAQKVIKEIEKLKELVKPYSCNVFGRRGVFNVLEMADKVEICVGVMSECHSNGVWCRGLGK